MTAILEDTPTSAFATATLALVPSILEESPLAARARRLRKSQLMLSPWRRASKQTQDGTVAPKKRSKSQQRKSGGAEGVVEAVAQDVMSRKASQRGLSLAGQPILKTVAETVAETETRDIVETRGIMLPEKDEEGKGKRDGRARRESQKSVANVRLRGSVMGHVPRKGSPLGRAGKNSRDRRRST